MRRIALLVIALLAGAAIVVGALWWVDGRSERSGVVVPAPRESTTTAPTAPPPQPTTTTTTWPGLPLPLDPRPVRIAWAGDSVAFTLAPSIRAVANARGIEVVDRSVPGCGMVRGLPTDDSFQPIEMSRSCDVSIPAHNDGTARSGADAVTWFSTWETSNRIVDGTEYVFGTPEGDAKLLELIDESAQLLMAGGARLVILTMPPTAPGEIRPVVDETANAEAAHLNELLKQYARAHPDRVAVLDLGAIVCPGGPPCPTTIDGVVLRPEDGGHFGAAGAAWAAPRILDQLVGPA